MTALSSIFHSPYARICSGMDFFYMQLLRQCQTSQNPTKLHKPVDKHSHLVYTTPKGGVLYDMSDIGENLEIYFRTPGYLSGNERCISVRH